MPGCVGGNASCSGTVTSMVVSTPPRPKINLIPLAKCEGKILDYTFKLEKFNLIYEQAMQLRDCTFIQFSII